MTLTLWNIDKRKMYIFFNTKLKGNGFYYKIILLQICKHYEIKTLQT